MVEGIEAVGTAEGRKAGGGQASIEYLGRGLANPLQAGLAGVVAEWQDEEDSAVSAGGLGSGLRAGLKHEEKKKREW